jgi:hypothetical protein
MVEEMVRGLPPGLQGMPENVIDEARYELMCQLPQFRPEEADKMSLSGLATIISKCADTAIYLPKKRFEDMDDMKVVLFDVDHGDAHITNGDVIIRVSDIPQDILEGLNSDIPAYDYLSEKFIPNPLPYTLTDLNRAFFNDYTYSMSMPVRALLDRIYYKYPTAVDRRGTFTVIDVGYGMYEGSVLIPQFFDGPKKFFQLQNGKPFIIAKGSLILDQAIVPGTPYVCFPVEDTPDYLSLNVYKRYGNYVTFGLYKILSPALSDDIHPFDLESYGDMDKLTIPLQSEIDRVTDYGEKMQLFRGFRPLAIETEYLYHVLLMLGSFGYEGVNIHIRNTTDEPILFEGIRCEPDQPTVEAVVATIQIGEDGRKCEQILSVNPPW